jgi:hypothetical protein
MWNVMCMRGLLMIRRRSTLFGLMMVSGLLAAVLQPARPSAAQSGSPRDGAIILNSSGGGSIDAAPKFTINGDGTFAAQFDGELVTGGTEFSPATGFMFYTGGALYGSPTLTSRSEAPTKVNWASSTVTETVADAAAEQVLSTGSYTLTITYQTLAPAGMTIRVAVTPTPPDTSTRLYFVSNANANGQPLNAFEDYYIEAEEDNILSYDDEDAGMRYLVGFTNYPGGFYADSLIYGSEPCVFGKLSGCPSSGPAGGAQYNGDQEASDLAIGGEWMPYIAAPELTWVTFAAPIPPAEEEPTDEQPVAPAQQCLNTTDMAISPERIELAPGGEAVVNLTLRNTDTVPQGYHDVVLSLSDGLSVTAVSDGMRNLGRRAALERLVLQPNETRSMAVTVSAADSLPTAPIHVAELYCGGRVVSRIDGVFVPVAAVSAPVVTVVEAPAPTAAPAPLPAVLPNTAGESSNIDPSLAIWPLLILLTAWLLRQRRNA